MRQIVFLSAAIRRQVAEELGVEKTLVESALGDREQREEEHAEQERGQERIRDHQKCSI